MVVSIIAVLAAILFPVFAQAREKARQTTCASNLRGLGTAVLMYAQDYDEALPLAAYPAGGYSYVAWHDMVNPYVRDTRIWHCPSSQIAVADTVGGKITSHFGYNASYLTNIRLDFANVATQTAVALGDVKSPAETVLLSDARASKPRSYCGDDGKYLLPPSAADTDCWGRPAPLHAEGANVSWLDGHVKWARPGQFYTGQTPPDRFFDRD